MVAAISPSSFRAADTAGASPIAGLEAQLQRYQKALSECVNCDSAKTVAGKQTIQAISSKISDVRARIEEIVVTKTDNRPVTSSSAEAHGATTAPRDDKLASESVAAAKPNPPSVGTLVDVFA